MVRFRAMRRAKTYVLFGALIALGSLVLLFGVAASWPVPILTTEVEKLLGVVAIMCGPVMIVRALRSNRHYGFTPPPTVHADRGPG